MNSFRHSCQYLGVVQISSSTVQRAPSACVSPDASSRQFLKVWLHLFQQPPARITSSPICRRQVLQRNLLSNNAHVHQFQFDCDGELYNAASRRQHRWLCQIYGDAAAGQFRSCSDKWNPDLPVRVRHNDVSVLSRGRSGVVFLLRGRWYEAIGSNRLSSPAAKKVQILADSREGAQIGWRSQTIRTRRILIRSWSPIRVGMY